MAFFVSFHSLCLKVYFIGYEYCYSCFPLVSICLEYLFPAFHFQSVFVPCFEVGFPGGSDGKASACNAGDPGSIPRLGRSPGEGNGNPLQYSCLENAMERRAWQATVYGVAKSWTRLSDFTFFFLFFLMTFKRLNF